MKKDEILGILDRAYFSEHSDEQVIIEALPSLLRGVRHFVDVGASLGQFTFHANRILQDSRIEAIEAEPLRCERLAQNCKGWAADRRNLILVHHAAASRKSGEIEFHSTQSNVSGGLFPHSLDHIDERTREEVQWTSMRVPAVALDDLFEHSIPEFIKMDIEGAEGEALQGAKRILGERRTRWLIELHSFPGGWSPRETIAYMRLHGHLEQEIAPGRFYFRPATYAAQFQRLARRGMRAARRFSGL